MDSLYNAPSLLMAMVQKIFGGLATPVSYPELYGKELKESLQW